MKNQFFLKTLPVLLIFLFSAVVLFAQTFSGPPSFTTDVQDNPIDGGLGLLLGAGVAYGAKKIRDRRQKGRGDNPEEE